jgi:ribosome modulation factor
MRRRAEIASWFALPVNYQPDMFSDASPLEDTAFGQGVAAGLRGKDPVPPYDLPSKPGQRWMEGWHDGQRQARDDLQTAMEKRNAARDELIKKADDDGTGAEDPGFEDEAA